MPQRFAHPPHNDAGPRPPRVAVLGAALGTGNLGVDALGMAMVQGLVTAMPDVQILYQAWDTRLRIAIPHGDTLIECEPLAIRRRGSLRFRDGLQQVQRLGQLRRWLSARSITKVPAFSRTLQQLLSCDAILDVSAGDSFANIYGDEVFWYQSQIKLLCLDLGLPLVLMPQTYGPFHDETSRSIAGEILSRATLACSREAAGLEEVRQLCGSRPPQKLARIPDMAFLLEPQNTTLPNALAQARASEIPCIAINVSGLLFFGKRNFGLNLEFRRFIQRVTEWALSLPQSHVLLVPHVIAPSLQPNSKNTKVPSADRTDFVACKQLLETLSPTARQRISLLPEPRTPGEAKFAMSQCDYFIGARMHAFIGAASQCVPGSLLAYSKKAEGLASLLDIADNVVDMRKLTADECLAAVDRQYQHREAMRQTLEQRVPQARDEIHQFFSEQIVPIIRGKSISRKSSPNGEVLGTSETERVLN